MGCFQIVVVVAQKMFQDYFHVYVCVYEKGFELCIVSLVLECFAARKKQNF
jgi:hypothetical protein